MSSVISAASGLAVAITLTPIGDVSDRRLITVRPGSSVVFGRASTSGQKHLQRARDNAFFDCPVISRTHAKLDFNPWAPTPKQFSLTDNNSMHGTFLNGDRLRPGRPTPLNSGDTIKLGDTVTRGESAHTGLVISFEHVQRPECSSSLADQPEVSTSPGFHVSVPSDDDDDFSDDDGSVGSDEVVVVSSSAKTTPEQAKGSAGSKQLPIVCDDLQDSPSASCNLPRQSAPLYVEDSLYVEDEDQHFTERVVADSLGGNDSVDKDDARASLTDPSTYHAFSRLDSACKRLDERRSLTVARARNLQALLGDGVVDHSDDDFSDYDYDQAASACYDEDEAFSHSGLGDSDADLSDADQELAQAPEIFSKGEPAQDLGLTATDGLSTVAAQCCSDRCCDHDMVSDHEEDDDHEDEDHASTSDDDVVDDNNAVSALVNTSTGDFDSAYDQPTPSPERQSLRAPSPLTDAHLSIHPSHGLLPPDTGVSNYWNDSPSSRPRYDPVRGSPMPTSPQAPGILESRALTGGVRPLTSIHDTRTLPVPATLAAIFRDAQAKRLRHSDAFVEDGLGLLAASSGENEAAWADNTGRSDFQPPDQVPDGFPEMANPLVAGSHTQPAEEFAKAKAGISIPDIVENDQPTCAATRVGKRKAEELDDVSVAMGSVTNAIDRHSENISTGDLTSTGDVALGQKPEGPARKRVKSSTGTSALGKMTYFVAGSVAMHLLFSYDLVNKLLDSVGWPRED